VLRGDKDFALDPTHRHFSKAKDGEFVKAVQAKRQKTAHQ
jgi:hypothetical protein